ncbi:2931_t:CDS:2 [Rhizophagus irregularis]|nr:2931_t:CDS:2 [Rhizophagus irregularis]
MGIKGLRRCLRNMTYGTVSPSKDRRPLDREKPTSFKDSFF